jgi:hypothetical protein
MSQSPAGADLRKGHVFGRLPEPLPLGAFPLPRIALSNDQLHIIIASAEALDQGDSGAPPSCSPVSRWAMSPSPNRPASASAVPKRTGARLNCTQFVPGPTTWVQVIS